MIQGRRINPYHVRQVSFAIFNYLVFVYMYMISLKPPYYVFLLVIFHVLFIMLLISMFKAITTTPGIVPLYWGIFEQESKTGKRRYCLICHSFKPERSHHCSTCKRCIYNMDHHCPWIGNCVGFTNRKVFVLLLFYMVLTLIFMISCELPIYLAESKAVMKDLNNQLTVPFIVRSIGIMVHGAFLAIMSMFFKFHLELVFFNSSTLDEYKKKRKPEASPNVYNVGIYENFVQVFGTNLRQWLLPVAPKIQRNANGEEWPNNQ